MNFVYLRQVEDLDLEILMKMANHLNLQNGTLLMLSPTRSPLILHRPYSSFIYDYDRAVITDAPIYEREGIWMVFRGLDDPQRVMDAYLKRGPESLALFNRTMFALLWDDRRKEMIFVGNFYSYRDEIGENFSMATNPVVFYRTFHFVRDNLSEIVNSIVLSGKRIPMNPWTISTKKRMAVRRCSLNHPVIYDEMTPQEYFSIPHLKDESPFVPTRTYLAEYILKRKLSSAPLNGKFYRIHVPLKCYLKAGISPLSLILSRKKAWRKFAYSKSLEFIASLPF